LNRSRGLFRQRYNIKQNMYALLNELLLDLWLVSSKRIAMSACRELRNKQITWVDYPVKTGLRT